MTNLTNNNIRVNTNTLAAAIAKGADLHFYTNFQGIRSTDTTTGVVTHLNNEVHAVAYPDYYTMVSATPGVKYWDVEEVDCDCNTLTREVQEGNTEELNALKADWAIWPVFFERFRAALSFPVQVPDMFGKTKEEYRIIPSELMIDRVRLAQLIDWNLVKEEAPVVADYSHRVIRSTEKVGGTFADLF